MAEYIEKGALYLKVAELEMLARDRYLETSTNSPVYPRYMAQFGEREHLKLLIADFPTADVEPVRHGRWIATAYTTTSKRRRVISNVKYACSECERGNGRTQSNFCPHCGADMRGADNGE